MALLSSPPHPNKFVYKLATCLQYAGCGFKGCSLVGIMCLFGQVGFDHAFIAEQLIAHKCWLQFSVTWSTSGLILLLPVYSW